MCTWNGYKVQDLIASGKKNGHSPVGKTGRHTPKDKNGGNNEKGQGQEVPNKMMKESLSGKVKGGYGRQT